MYYFARWGGRLIHALDVLELSRHLYLALTPKSAVVALSYSGETVRALEACIAAKSRGARLIVLTSDPGSSMAQLADHVILNQAAREQSNCRTGSFQSMHISLLLLALAMNRADPSKRVRARVLAVLDDLVTSLDQYVVETESAMERLARDLDGTRRFYFLGAGIGWPIARYGYSKLYETASAASIASELEQFAHGEIFSLDPPDCVIIIAQGGPSFARAIEVAKAVKQIGATVWGLSDNGSFEQYCDHFTAWPRTEFEELAAVAAVIPLQWFAFYRALLTNSDPDRVRHKEVNSPLIRQCALWSADDYARWARKNEASDDPA
jgi:glucosamine--fructose-6-phosphate aminotransferase (isomerizing)